MPVLGKTELMQLLTDQLTIMLKRKPKSVDLHVDWTYIDYDKKNREYYFDTKKKEWKYIIKLHDGYTYRYLDTVCVRQLIRHEYLDAKDIHIDIRIKDNFDLLNTKTIDEVIKLMDITANIELDNEVLLSKEEIKNLIDLSLDMGNKEMFMEYTAQYNSYN